MTRIARRKLLTHGGGMAAILAAGQGPALAQEKSVHWLRWTDFVPASDALLKGQFTQDCKKATGINLKVETVNANDLQSRITSAIQSGSGADIIQALHNWPHLYADSVTDVSDVTEEIAAQQGGFYDIFPVLMKGPNGWLGVPWCALGILLCYRKSWFDEIGFTSFPDTWDKYRAAGKLLKAKGRPIGQTLGHAYGDALVFSYPYLWSWGGQEVEADGKAVVLDSKATVESVKFMTGFWKDAHDEGGLAWDDSSNNRAFLSGTCSSTNNGASIYLEAKKKPETYLTEKGAPLWKDIFHTRLPKGPSGQFTFPFPFSDMVMGYSKNQKAAKEFLTWVHSKPVFEKWFTSQQGFTLGPTAQWQNHPLWQNDPVMLPFRSIADIGRAAGYAGRPSRAAAEVVTKYIITDMYAKAVQGMPAEDAVKWAHAELVKIYA